MEQCLWVPDVVPSLNEILEAKRARRGKFADGYSLTKKAWGQKVRFFALQQRLRPMEGRCHFVYLFLENSRRRDPSNFVSVGLKLIEDGLQAAGVIKNDGWKQVGSIGVHWELAGVNKAGVFTWMTNAELFEPPTLGQMLLAYGQFERKGLTNDH